MSGASRFSPSAYSARVRAGTGSDEVEGRIEEAVLISSSSEKPALDFAKAAEDMRAYLSSPRGMTEEERREYGERLNRAVLGYPRERKEIMALVQDRLLKLRLQELPGMSGQYHSLAEALFAEVIGLGVLELALQDRSGLEEIQVVGTGIYLMREGRTERSSYRFQSLKEVERIQQNLVLYNNDRINRRKRWAEVMLRDGTRVTMTGFGFTSQPTLTMRFYNARAFRLDELALPDYGTLTHRIVLMLKAVLACRYNLVLIGPTGSGKTHLLKSLIAELPDEERLVTLESRLEMMLGRDFPDKNVVEYETDEEDALHRPAQAFKLALRQSPQRIIHAEIRDEDANIYVRACTRGHSGSMTTVHASRLEDVPEAITDMCMLDNRAMNPDRLCKRITRYVTQIGIEMKLADGKRRITRLGELHWEEGEVRLEEWAAYRTGRGWTMASAPGEATRRRLADAGLSLDEAGFWSSASVMEEDAGSTPGEPDAAEKAGHRCLPGKTVEADDVFIRHVEESFRC
ncbi:Flp pilus assembly complex ATPase component TadA [Paenibacillus pasadenensis]|uniref:ATPase, T2SS/T4P/T4SS family n=1 Tax=Paenibacillus pasadenensis TaxID=217090 RepID=UPI00203E5525|nr:ATPase, T2SS/T4P/T4SS family [Paenibacillus pasadenensis]MCM3749079.1 Flp pilus assembly complex ATPase component TadA [Paenibacillus pasadenensis]